MFGWTQWKPMRKDKVCQVCGARDTLFERDFKLFGIRIKHQEDCEKCKEFLTNGKKYTSPGSKRRKEKEKKYGEVN